LLDPKAKVAKYFTWYQDQGSIVVPTALPPLSIILNYD